MKNAIVFFIVVTVLCSFSLISIDNSIPSSNCSMEIEKVDDSTYVISNYNIGYQLKTEVMIGHPSIILSNDTIYTSGDKYSVAVFTRDSSNCVMSQLITKF